MLCTSQCYISHFKVRFVNLLFLGKVFNLVHIEYQELVQHISALESKMEVATSYTGRS